MDIEPQMHRAAMTQELKERPSSKAQVGFTLPCWLPWYFLMEDAGLPQQLKFTSFPDAVLPLAHTFRPT